MSTPPKSSVPVSSINQRLSDPLNAYRVGAAKSDAVQRAPAERRTREIEQVLDSGKGALQIAAREISRLVAGRNPGNLTSYAYGSTSATVDGETFALPSITLVSFDTSDRVIYTA